MARQFVFQIGRIEGTGHSERAARDDATIQASRAISGSFDPFLFSDRGHTLLVWREPLIGWTHKVLWPGRPDTGPDVRACMVANEHMREVGISKGIYHFAQSVYPCMSELPEALRKGLRAMDLDDLAHWYKIRQELPR